MIYYRKITMLTITVILLLFTKYVLSYIGCQISDDECKVPILYCIILLFCNYSIRKDTIQSVDLSLFGKLTLNLTRVSFD